MRIASGQTTLKIPFVAVDATDLVTRETGLSSFTVRYSRNGGTLTAYTTPTVAELSSSNAPGVYMLTVDEGTTLDDGVDDATYLLHITQASMAPVTMVVELYRAKATLGETLTVNSTGGATVGALQSNVITATSIASAAITAAKIDSNAITAAKLDDDAVAEIQSGLATASGQSAQATATALATLQADLDSLTADVAVVDSTADSILADTDNIQTRIPAALVSGRMDASVGAMASGVVTAAAVATGAIDADAIAADAGNKLADHNWRRASTSIEASANGDSLAFRSPYGAVAKLTNKIDIATGTLTVRRANDTTALGTQAVTTDSGADNITELDTA
jgi:hypothetical protein